MQRLFERGLVAVSAAVFAGMGLWTVIDPITPLAAAGVVVADPRGLVELRAMYGGLELGMAAFLAWCLTDERVRIGLLAAAFTIGGLGAVRLASWLVIRPDGWLLPLLCVVELGGAAAAIFTYWRGRPPP